MSDLRGGWRSKPRWTCDRHRDGGG